MIRRRDASQVKIRDEMDGRKGEMKSLPDLMSATFATWQGEQARLCVAYVRRARTGRGLVSVWGFDCQLAVKEDRAASSGFFLERLSGVWRASLFLSAAPAVRHVWTIVGAVL